MASLYKQKKSAFWWIKYRDPVNNTIVRKSTKLKELVRAQRLCADYTHKESQMLEATPNELWDRWVSGFFQRRYKDNKLRAECAWRMLRMFLHEHGLFAPRQVLRDHATQYLNWRAMPNKSQAKYRAGLNTTILEIKFMSIILDEAVRNGYALYNPWLKLNLHRDHQKVKPEYPRAALAQILWAIRKEPRHKRRFFLYSFLIARYHGCRLSETHFNPKTQVDNIDGPHPTITFLAKGKRLHTVYLHPKLVRRFRRMVAEGRTETFTPPASPAKEWFLFLTRCGIKKKYPGACFHSLRVTAATTLARAGVSEKKAMDYIGHASTTVHRSYVRLNADLSVCADALA